jgi:glycine oxidase
MGQNPDFVILGGGVIGLTTAYHLARRNARVLVLDQGDPGREASWAGAGMIPAAPSPDRARTPYQRLLALSNSLFPRLSEELRELTAADNGYVARGSIEILDSEEEMLAHWRDEGIDFEELRGPTLHDFEPALSRELAKAFFLPGSAQVRNPRHLKALQAACARFDVGLLPSCPATGFERRGNRVTAVQTPGGPIPAGAFLVAAGPWTDGLLAPLGCRLGVRPVRGQIVLLNARPALLTRAVVRQVKHYLVPRPDGRVLVGATEEEGGFDKRTTAGAVAGLLDFACGLVPELAGAQVERCWAGLRPGSPDGLPFLGAVPGFDNLFVAAGHFRAGIQLSAATGVVMSDLLLGRTPAVPLHAFRPDRTPATPAPRP